MDKITTSMRQCRYCPPEMEELQLQMLKFLCGSDNSLEKYEETLIEYDD